MDVNDTPLIGTCHSSAQTTANRTPAPNRNSIPWRLGLEGIEGAQYRNPGTSSVYDCPNSGIQA